MKTKKEEKDVEKGIHEVSLNHETHIVEHEGINLAKMFAELSPADKAGVTHFFNLHNAAVHIFSLLSPSGVEYAELCVKLSQEGRELENEEEEKQ